MQHLALFEESNSLPRVAVENVTDIYDTFKQCEIANSAAEAISNEIALCNLQWSAEDAVSDTIKSSTWTTFVKHALVQMLVTGVVVWKKIAPREGQPQLEFFSQANTSRIMTKTLSSSQRKFSSHSTERKLTFAQFMPQTLSQGTSQHRQKWL